MHGYLIYIRHCSSALCIEMFSCLKATSWSRLILLSSFYTKENWAIERLSNLHLVLKLEYQGIISRQFDPELISPRMFLINVRINRICTIRLYMNRMIFPLINVISIKYLNLDQTENRVFFMCNHKIGCLCWKLFHKQVELFDL